MAAIWPVWVGWTPAFGDRST